MGIGHGDTQLSVQELEKLKKSFFTVSDKEEMRGAVRLSKVGHENIDREFYNVEASKQENLAIDKFLDHSHELKLSEREMRGLNLRKTRNVNFELMNQEKWLGDSDKMKDVKDSIKAYEEALTEKIDLSSKEATKDSIGHVSDLADQAVDKCLRYLARGKSCFFWRKGRYDAVEKAHDRLKVEQKELDGIFNKLFNEIQNEGHVPESDKISGLIEEGDTALSFLEAVNTRAKVRGIEKESRKEKSDKKKKGSEKKSDSENKEKEVKKSKKYTKEELELPQNAKLKEKYEKRKAQKRQKEVNVFLGKIKGLDDHYNHAINSKNELINRAARRENVKNNGKLEGAYRDDMKTVSNMAFLYGYSEKEMLSFYSDIKVNLAQKPPVEKKVAKVKCIETVFKTIEDFDLSKINFKNFGDLYSNKYMRLKAITTIAKAADYYAGEYQKLMEDTDSGVKCNFDDNRLKEFRAKANTLMGIDTYLANVPIVFKELGYDGMKELSKSMDELKALAGSRINLHLALMNLKALCYKDGVGDQVFGQGVDIKGLYNIEREKLGLNPV